MSIKNKRLTIHRLGSVPYQEIHALQERLLDEAVRIKLANRHLASSHQKPTPNHLIFCEHPHVYTLGRSGCMEDLLVGQEQLQDEDIHFHRISRGGGITYHGPGQLVAYPVIDLDNLNPDIHQYIRTIEQVVIATLQDLGLSGKRIKGLPGVWVDGATKHHPAKICAVGVRVSRWVTMHGFSLNVDPELHYFDRIIPCGIKNKAITSIANELGVAQDMSIVLASLEQHFLDHFGMTDALGRP